MRTLKTWLTTIALLLCCLTASAHDFEVRGVYYNITSDTDLTVEVTYRGSSYYEYSNEYSGAVTIPSTVAYESSTYSVTSIGDYAFLDCSNLTAINMPESVTSIGNNAFHECSNLTAINIPESVTSIGECAFNSCSSLTSINIPENVTSIGWNAITHCSSLTAITVDANNTVYNSRNGCNAIIKTADNELIAGCSATLIPEGVTSIRGWAFASCSSLTSIIIPSSVTSIGSYAFERCSSLTSITIPESVTSIGDGAFNGCSSLTAINIPEGVTSIRNYAFEGCSSLTAINIPEGVTSIGNYAFEGCSSLTAINIPEGVTSIGNYAFSYCSGLTSITCEAVTPPIINNNTFYGMAYDTPVYVPASSVSVYQSAEHWSLFTNICPIKKELALDDGEDFSQQENKEHMSVTYTRSFADTNWQALYVPFEIPVTEDLLIGFEVADLNNVHQYDNDDDNITDETVIEAFKVTSGVLEANYPYLIRAKEMGEKSIVVTDATLYATEENSIDCSSVREKFTFTGTYNHMSSNELTPNEGYYTLIDGEWQPVTEKTTLGAFRFYLKVDSRNSNAVMARTIRMRVVGADGSVEDGTTDVESSVLEAQGSQFIYDLQGRRVENPTKGIYIVDGKKVVL